MFVVLKSVFYGYLVGVDSSSVPQSLFNRLYSYRQREQRSPREDFLTELFAFCLQAHPAVLTEFAKLLAVEEELAQVRIVDPSSIVIRTQEYRGDFGRTDLELQLGSYLVVVECKVEAELTEAQLQQYTQFLEENHPGNSKLACLTKYYVQPETPVHRVRWGAIHASLPKKPDTLLLQQFKTYLEEENLHRMSNFEMADLSAMQQITDTISKMDEVLNKIPHSAYKQLGKHRKDVERAKRLRKRWYGDERACKHFHIYWGFYWPDDTSIPAAYVEVEHYGTAGQSEPDAAAKAKIKEIAALWDEELWESGREVGVAFTQPITELLQEEPGNHTKLLAFYEARLEVLGF